MLAAGDRVTLCRKVMGRRRGEPLVRIVDVEILSVRREPLNVIGGDDLAAEGFAAMSVEEFIEFFCASHRGCQPATEVTRIEWRYIEPSSPLFPDFNTNSL
ncbi:hypothetical protein [Nocardia sp. NPDC057272]|uniref:hypothetical protein n=1 Tax=Nocardia sp. NPDC057272 TaxID=3346079 RepID=UPI0036263BE7